MLLLCLRLAAGRWEWGRLHVFVFVGLALLDLLDLFVVELHAWGRLVGDEVEVDGGDLVLEEDADGGDGEGFPEEILVEECAADGVDTLLPSEGM